MHPFFVSFDYRQIFDNQIASAETRDSAVWRHDGYISRDRNISRAKKTCREE